MLEDSAIVTCQRFYRGYCDRKLVKNLRKKAPLLKILDAIISIQRAYRNWKVFLSARFKKPLKKAKKRCMISVRDDGKDESYWLRTMSGKGNFNDKLRLWRNIIELRKENHEASVDLCLHAMFQAEGILSKSQIIISSNEFISDHEFKLLNSTQEDFFMPITSTCHPSKKKPSSKMSIHLYNSLQAGQSKTSTTYNSLKKSFFYRKPSFRNPTPSYLLRKSQSPQKQSLPSKKLKPLHKHVSTSLPTIKLNKLKHDSFVSLPLNEISIVHSKELEEILSVDTSLQVNLEVSELLEELQLLVMRADASALHIAVLETENIDHSCSESSFA